ncbi:MAG TPA: LytTR family DNA-binding domain-containing protein [Chitinophagales bacterium]|nr:LytTR family DNA-binding domain-containing protein [Chitinophagales bacterium]
MFNTIIIEDDPLALQLLKDHLHDHFSDYKVIAEFNLVKEAIRSIGSLSIDLLFLDMELPDGKGFDLLEKFPVIGFEVIITSGYESYMLQAIRHSALDYLIKPVRENELRNALTKFEQKISSLKKSRTKPSPLPLISKLPLPTSEGLVFVNVSDIIRLESGGPYTTFMMKGGTKYMTSKTLGVYEEQLAGHSFFRVHHSHLINLDHISRYVKGEGGYVIMSDNSSVDVSRRKKEEFMNAIGL